jgi:S-adenosylmethionine:tRNA ribosyltransferase-isomerase
MRIEEFDYLLPKEMIAQFPAEERTSSRLLVLDRGKGTIAHRHFQEITDYLHEGDLLVLNDSKVFPARLIGKKSSGGAVDILLVEKTSPDKWLCLVKNAKKGTDRLDISIGDQRATLTKEESSWSIRFLYDGDSDDIITQYGKMPLPPYIKRNNGNGNDGNGAVDFDRYQTVYARARGSIAAPTAGFHFSEELINAIEKIGVQIAKITLHIGVGTFNLIKSPDVEGHSMHHEYYELDEMIKKVIRQAKDEGRRIVACGTSAVRTLETIFTGNGGTPLRGNTGLFIYPGYQFKMVDALITNFHLPRSTPLLLASAFAGRDALMKCYEEAKENGYRFYSYGDSMLIV